MSSQSAAFEDYQWNKGIPVGMRPVDVSTERAYKVITDPYHRYYVVEAYHKGSFDHIAYDSTLFDFRWLQPAAQMGWQKELIDEDDNTATYLIRSMEERILLKEEYLFREGACVKCRAFSPHGILVSIQHILYVRFGDPFNGVILYDANGHPVTLKRYEIDKLGEFTNLLDEQWENIALM